MDTQCDRNRRELGSKIRDIRNAQGLSLRTLGQMVGMDYAYISKLENGKENPTLDQLSRLAAGLDVDISALFSPGKGTDYAFTSFD